MKHPLHFSACLLGFAALAACAVAPAADVNLGFKTSAESMALNNAGLDYMQRGDTFKAETCFLKALERRPDLAIAHLNLGLLYQNTGKFAEAQQQYNLAIKDDPATRADEPIKHMPEDLDNRSVGEIAWHKIVELPVLLIAQAG